MRGLLVAVLLLTAGTNFADEAKKYDLRGPAPVEGQVFVGKTTMQIKDATMTLKSMGQTIETKAKMEMLGEEEQKILAVKGRLVTKCQTRIIKDRVDVTLDLAGGMSNTETSELEGKTIISERDKGDQWKHILQNGKPTEKQKKELDKLTGIENDDDLYPAEKVAVGHQWKADARSFTKMLGNAFTNVKGELKQKFLKVEKINGEDCAVIESAGVIKGKMKDDDGKPTIDFEMDIKATAWRSLKSGVELKSSFAGKIKFSGKQTIDAMEVEISVSGSMTGQSTTQVK